jgi:hypothetical protein
MVNQCYRSATRRQSSWGIALVLLERESAEVTFVHGSDELTVAACQSSCLQAWPAADPANPAVLDLMAKLRHFLIN